MSCVTFTLIKERDQHVAIKCNSAGTRLRILRVALCGRVAGSDPEGGLETKVVEDIVSVIDKILGENKKVANEG